VLYKNMLNTEKQGVIGRIKVVGVNYFSRLQEDMVKVKDTCKHTVGPSFKWNIFFSREVREGIEVQ
jgi:hypothetical protein